MLALALLPGIANAIPAEVVTNTPQKRGPSSQGPIRGGVTGEAQVGDAHGHFAEMARSGNLFMMDSDNITLAAAFQTKSALGTVKFINGIYNPGPLKNAEIEYASVVTSTYTISGGPFFFNYYCGVTLTNASGGTIRSGLLNNSSGGGSVMIPITNVAIVVSGGATTAINQLEVIGGMPQTGALGLPTATSLPNEVHALIDGRIIVPPGCIFGITSLGAGVITTGVTHQVQSTLVWEEL